MALVASGLYGIFPLVYTFHLFIIIIIFIQNSVRNDNHVDFNITKEKKKSHMKMITLA